MNLIAPLSAFEGGHLWVADGVGSVSRYVKGAAAWDRFSMSLQDLAGLMPGICTPLTRGPGDVMSLSDSRPGTCTSFLRKIV